MCKDGRKSIDSPVGTLGLVVNACTEGDGIDCTTIGMTLAYGASRTATDLTVVQWSASRIVVNLMHRHMFLPVVVRRLYMPRDDWLSVRYVGCTCHPRTGSCGTVELRPV